MRINVCFEIDPCGELIYCKSFIDRAKARKWFLDCVERETHGSLSEIDAAVREAEIEFDNYVPRCMDAEADGIAIVKVIETED